MAAGGADYTGSPSLSSDQVFDHNCNLCEGDEKISEAISYCQACYKYYCSQCLDFHNKFHPGHRRTLLDMTAMPKTQAQPVARGTLTTMCEEHEDKLVEMFCFDHQVVCCTICLAINHKKCEHVDYVPKIAEGFCRSPDIAKTKSNLQEVRNDLMSAILAREDDQKRIEREKDEVLAQIKRSRQKMNEVFNKLEDMVIQGADKRLQEFGNKIQTNLIECGEEINKLDKAISELENATAQQETQLFVCVKRSTENLKVWRELCRKTEALHGRETIKFRIDTSIEEYVASIEKLGSFVDELKVSRCPRTVVQSEKAEVKIKGEKRICSIQGSCYLPDGRVLLSDIHNNKLKRLDSSYRLADSFDLAGPRGVCYVPESNQAAVCLAEQSIAIVSLERKMALVRSIKMKNHNCFGLAFNHGKFFVGQYSGNKVHVYDSGSGQYLNTVHRDKDGRDIFSYNIYHVAVRKDGSKIYVADYDAGLIVLDKACNLLRVVKDEEFDGVTGVCLDADENVLVSSSKSRTILQFSPEGEKMCTLVRPGDVSTGLLSIAYDTTRSHLLAAFDDNDRIKVFHTK